MTRFCPKCKDHKDTSAFGYRSNEHDGLSKICKSCFNRDNRAWRLANQSASNAIYKKREDRHKLERSVLRKKIAQKWRICNPSKVAQNMAKRRARKSAATPPRLSTIHLAQIQEFYDISLAKTTQTGVRYEVDHIHPLRGKGFSGMHVPWNLQVISKLENQSKANNLPESDKVLGWSN
jgi:hypothetical protein